MKSSKACPHTCICPEPWCQLPAHAHAGLGGCLDGLLHLRDRCPPHVLAPPPHAHHGLQQAGASPPCCRSAHATDACRPSQSLADSIHAEKCQSMPYRQAAVYHSLQQSGVPAVRAMHGNFLALLAEAACCHLGRCSTYSPGSNHATQSTHAQAWCRGKMPP